MATWRQVFGAFNASTEDVRYVVLLSQGISALLLLRRVEDRRRRQARRVGPVHGLTIYREA
jgi:hypothetical protein